MRIVNHDGIEMMFVDIDPQNQASPEKIEEMEGYAAVLWKFAADRKINPVFASLFPDKERIIIEVKNQNDGTRMLQGLRERGFIIKPDKFAPGHPQIYSPITSLSKYVVMIEIERTMRSM